MILKMKIPIPGKTLLILRLVPGFLKLTFMFAPPIYYWTYKYPRVLYILHIVWLIALRLCYLFVEYDHQKYIVFFYEPPNLDELLDQMTSPKPTLS